MVIKMPLTTKKELKLTSRAIRTELTKFLRGRKPEERYTSYDYCYNYFRSFHYRRREQELASSENIQVSCLHLCFYLASWGMLRGSSPLLGKSLKYYETVIKLIAKFDRRIWDIDVPDYNNEKDSALLLKCRDKISMALGHDSEILATKVLLGVFGCTPALDKNFAKAFHIWHLTRKSLQTLYRFYRDHKDVLDGFDVKTIDYTTGKDKKWRYSKAKLIDMIGFSVGLGT